MLNSFNPDLTGIIEERKRRSNAKPEKKKDSVWLARKARMDTALNALEDQSINKYQVG